MGDINSVWVRAKSGRLERQALRASAPVSSFVECIVCAESVSIYHYCGNNHKTCISCMEKHFVNECRKMNTEVVKYMVRDIQNVRKFKLVCCPLLQACDCNLIEQFDIASVIREPKVSKRTTRIIIKTKQFVDRAIGHSIASRGLFS